MCYITVNTPTEPTGRGGTRWGPPTSFATGQELSSGDLVLVTLVLVTLALVTLLLFTLNLYLTCSHLIPMQHDHLPDCLCGKLPASLPIQIVTVFAYIGFAASSSIEYIFASFVFLPRPVAI